MKANLLIPEYVPQKRSLFTANANYPTTSATPKYPRSETRAAKVLRSLDQLSQKREHLYSTRILTGGPRRSSQICRYVFEGNQLRVTPIRIGIFAGLRGDDTVGPGAVTRFLEDLVAIPQLGENLRIYAYPVVHAAAFETATPNFRRSEYIINQIGCKTLSSESYQIEREIFAIAFDGIVTIRLEDEMKNLKVGISDARLHDTLVRPILYSLEPFFPGVESCICDSRPSLRTDNGLKRKPFELTLQVPSSGWPGLYSIGLRIALHTIVDCYRNYVMQSERDFSLQNKHSAFSVQRLAFSVRRLAFGGAGVALIHLCSCWCSLSFCVFFVSLGSELLLVTLRAMLFPPGTGSFPRSWFMGASPLRLGMVASRG
jgi:hypothetical protein